MPSIPKALSPGEEEFARHLACYKILAVREYQFDQKRKWRADFFIQPNLLVEVEGGSWSGGRHSRGAGVAKDCEKYNAATVNGFKVLRFTTEMVLTGAAIDTVRRCL